MKKKIHHHKHVLKTKRITTGKKADYLIVVRSWMLVVMFALMLGVGAIMGNFINQKMNESTPTVAGVQEEILLPEE